LSPFVVKTIELLRLPGVQRAFPSVKVTPQSMSQALCLLLAGPPPANVTAACQNPNVKPTIASTCVIASPWIETTQPPEQKNWPLLLISVK